MKQICTAIKPLSGLQKIAVHGAQLHSAQLHSPQFHYGLCNVRPFQGRAAQQTVGYLQRPVSLNFNMVGLATQRPTIGKNRGTWRAIA
jgi:hypothetical protein